MIIIIKGNPVDGLEYIGPFPDLTTAGEYADKIGNSDWWITRLTAPEEAE